MALDNYFKTLKLITGACEFTLVEDRSISSPRKEDDPQQECLLRNALRTSASKFTIPYYECDEPQLLFCPTRQLSSVGTDTTEKLPISIDSMEALHTCCLSSSQTSLSIDDSYDRSCGSDHVEPSAKTADSRWTFPENQDYLIHSMATTTTTTTCMQQGPQHGRRGSI